jgi:chromosome segregation ATPase
MSDESTGSAEQPGGLGEAAETLEATLRRFEELTTGACKIALNSEKNLARAARAINEAAASQERIASALGVLVKHINAAQVRQQTTSERVFARAKEIQERTREFESLMKELISVGEEAGAITSELQRLTENGIGAEQNGKHSLEPVLSSVQQRMTQAAARAQDVERRAREGGMHEVVRHADSLRQQIEAAREKLGAWTDV